MADTTVVFESHGRAVEVTLSATLSEKQLAYVEGWLGINQASGDSGDAVALEIEGLEYQWYVPDGLTVNKGDTVYIDSAQVTSHIPDDAGYATSSGAGRLAVFKATADKDTSRGAGNHFVTGVSVLAQQRG